MNPTANNIKQRLSLREPLAKALDVVVRLTDTLSLSKPDPDTLDEFIKSELAKAQTVCHCARTLNATSHRLHSLLQLVLVRLA